MKILIAPDKFKGTLDARLAAAAIERGIRKAVPDLPQDSVDLCPMADGGDGTVSILVEALGGKLVLVPTEDPLGRPISSAIGVALLDGVPTALVESASASGLVLLDPSELDPYTASTRGTGHLLSHCLGRDLPELAQISEVLLCVGGTATMDAGLGAIAALGAVLFDESGDPLGPRDALLFRTHAINPSEMPNPSRDGAPRLSIATDVTNSMLGEKGCVRTFGPQKGVDPSEFERFEEAMRRVCALYEEVFGVNPAYLLRSGAGGGLSGGLAAAQNGSLRDGFEVVASALHIHERIARADVVITGEGSLDRSSLQGKVVGKVVALAEASGVDLVIFAGRIDDAIADTRLGTAFQLSLESLARHSGEAMQRAADLLELAASIWAKQYLAAEKR